MAVRIDFTEASSVQIRRGNSNAHADADVITLSRTRIVVGFFLMCLLARSCKQSVSSWNFCRLILNKCLIEVLSTILSVRNLDQLVPLAVPAEVLAPFISVLSRLVQVFVIIDIESIIDTQSAKMQKQWNLSLA